MSVLNNMWIDVMTKNTSQHSRLSNNQKRKTYHYCDVHGWVLSDKWLEPINHNMCDIRVGLVTN